MPRQNMGLGKLGNPDLTFVRKFRWTLKGKYLNEWYNKSVNLDYSIKLLTFSTYEVYEKDGKIAIHEWADRMESGEYQDEELLFVTYDGCGNELYARKFTGLKVTNRNNHFDYADSDASMHRVVVTYDQCEVIPVTDQKHFPVIDKETEINFLNSKTWLNKEPGIPFNEFKALNQWEKDRNKPSV
jgi:hypothetical protein